jgi:hypothetical protein
MMRGPTAPGYGDALCRVNGWDAAIVAALSDHPQLAGTNRIADNVFHRSELVAAAGLIPEEWITESTAIGSVADCLSQLKRFRDAGADEMVTYGSTPGQTPRWPAPGWHPKTRPLQSRRDCDGVLLQIQRNPGHQPAIDDQVGPGDVARFVGH